MVLLNQREATAGGGYYGTLIGDWRRKGIYTSYQAECIARMPKEELVAVIIKAQHHCQSDSKSYGKMKLPFIQHEYILLWQKKQTTMLSLLLALAKQQYQRLTGTWKNIVRMVLVGLGGQATLPEIYAAVEAGVPEQLATNSKWHEKVRQTLNQNREMFRSVDRGLWAIA